MGLSELHRQKRQIVRRRAQGITEKGYAFRDMKKTKEIAIRADYELEVIRNKGYAPYFLVVSDLLRHAHEVGILTTTRGSAAGSLVSYLTGITNVDPFYFNLPFERFLNPNVRPHRISTWTWPTIAATR